MSASQASVSWRARTVRRAAYVGSRPVLAAIPTTGPARGLLRAAIDAPAVLDLLGGHGVTIVRPTRAGEPRGEWVLPDGRGPRPGRGVVLFLHGGGYVAGSVRGYRGALRLLAATSGLPVLGLDYRLAPEWPLPTALDDAVAAVAWLVEAGHPVESIRVVGDSAGAHLALELVTEMHARGLPAPRRLALFSPVLNPESTQA